MTQLVALLNVLAAAALIANACVLPTLSRRDRLINFLLAGINLSIAAALQHA